MESIIMLGKIKNAQVALLVIALLLTSCASNLPNRTIEPREVQNLLLRNQSWTTAAIWSFELDGYPATTFTGNAWHDKYGKEFIYVNSWHGSKTVLRLRNKKIDAPTDANPIKAQPSTAPSSKQRINNDLFSYDPLKYIIDSKVKLHYTQKNILVGDLKCITAPHEESGCTSIHVEITLTGNSQPKKIDYTLTRNSHARDKVTFYYDNFNKVKLEEVSKNINFKDLAPPDYSAIKIELQENEKVT